MGEGFEGEEVESFFDEEGVGGVGIADGLGEGDVVAHGEMRKEGCALGAVGEVAFVGGDAVVGFLKLDPAGGRGVGEGDGGVGKEAAGCAEDGALAAAGGAEEDGPGGVQGDAEMEV